MSKNDTVFTWLWKAALHINSPSMVSFVKGSIAKIIQFILNLSVNLFAFMFMKLKYILILVCV